MSVRPGETEPGWRCGDILIGAPTAQAVQLGAGLGGLRQTVNAVFHQARLLARASGPGSIPRRDWLGVLALLDPGQNLAQSFVLDDGCMADPLQLVEHRIG